jgi:hypothetical protein
VVLPNEVRRHPLSVKCIQVTGAILGTRAEIRQALLSQFSLLAELFIGKLVVKNYDSRVLELVNLNPGD